MKTLHITPIEYEPVYMDHFLGMYVFSPLCHSWVNGTKLEYSDMEVCVN